MRQNFVNSSGSREESQCQRILEARPRGSQARFTYSGFRIFLRAPLCFSLCCSSLDLWGRREEAHFRKVVSWRPKHERAGPTLSFIRWKPLVSWCLSLLPHFGLRFPRALATFLAVDLRPGLSLGDSLGSPSTSCVPPLAFCSALSQSLLMSAPLPSPVGLRWVMTFGYS